MPTLQDLQRGNSRTSVQSQNAFDPFADESIVTDERCELSPAQCVNEKLLRLLSGAEGPFETTSLIRRPR